MISGECSVCGTPTNTTPNKPFIYTTRQQYHYHGGTLCLDLSGESLVNGKLWILCPDCDREIRTAVRSTLNKFAENFAAPAKAPPLTSGTESQRQFDAVMDKVEQLTKRMDALEMPTPGEAKANMAAQKIPTSHESDTTEFVEYIKERLSRNQEGASSCWISVKDIPFNGEIKAMLRRPSVKVAMSEAVIGCSLRGKFVFAWYLLDHQKPKPKKDVRTFGTCKRCGEPFERAHKCKPMKCGCGSEILFTVPVLKLSTGKIICMKCTAVNYYTKGEFIGPAESPDAYPKYGPPKELTWDKLDVSVMLGHIGHRKNGWIEVEADTHSYNGSLARWWEFGPYKNGGGGERVRIELFSSKNERGDEKDEIHLVLDTEDELDARSTGMYIANANKYGWLKDASGNEKTVDPCPPPQASSAQLMLDEIIEAVAKYGEDLLDTAEWETIHTCGHDLLLQGGISRAQYVAIENVYAKVKASLDERPGTLTPPHATEMKCPQCDGPLFMVAGNKDGGICDLCEAEGVAR